MTMKTVKHHRQVVGTIERTESIMMTERSHHLPQEGNSHPQDIKRWRLMAAMLAACVLVTAGQSVKAQEGVGFVDNIDALGIANSGIVTNRSVLGGSALSRISGVSTTNMAAGDGNLQSNSGAIAIGDHATTTNGLFQQAAIIKGLSEGESSVGIQDSAFRQSQGWISINQTAGLGNVQSNTFGVALGISASNLSDATLQQVLADEQGLKGAGGTSGDTSRRVEIENTTFEGARGVIQVNQSAGTGNATANSFRLNMALGQ